MYFCTYIYVYACIYRESPCSVPLAFKFLDRIVIKHFVYLVYKFTHLNIIFKLCIHCVHEYISYHIDLRVFYRIVLFFWFQRKVLYSTNQQQVNQPTNHLVEVEGFSYSILFCCIYNDYILYKDGFTDIYVYVYKSLLNNQIYYHLLSRYIVSIF